MLLVLHHLKQCSSVTVPRTLLFDVVDLLPQFTALILPV
jgi:hypothetical protein